MSDTPRTVTFTADEIAATAFAVRDYRASFPRVTIGADLDVYLNWPELEPFLSSLIPGVEVTVPPHLYRAISDALARLIEDGPSNLLLTPAARMLGVPLCDLF
ncbi:hypothetical protein ACIOEX_11155 [Streptomyces sp. NPDC087850]|uniref:hypothetical protein n=1 Tax=Streptomyces sp. NPDC087850 TaxID=3365809 RepID=UPI0038062F5F